MVGPVHVCLEHEQIGLVEGLAGTFSALTFELAAALSSTLRIGSDVQGEPQRCRRRQQRANLVHNTAGLLGRDADSPRLRNSSCICLFFRGDRLADVPPRSSLVVAAESAREARPRRACGPPSTR